jgi:outer membrane protein TolC
VTPEGQPWRSVPDIIAAEANVAAAASAVELTRAERRPAVAVSADVGRYQPFLDHSAGTGLNPGTGTGAELTLNFTWPLWDAGGTYSARLAQAQLTAQMAADSAVVVRRLSELAWSRALEQLDDLYRIVELRSRSVPIAHDSYLQAQNLYRGGAGTALEVIDAYSAWVDAQIAEDDAIRDYRQAEAQLIRWGTP